MRKIRFTIGGLMAVVLGLAIGFAALRSANAIWAGTMLLLAHGLLGFAILGIVLRQGAQRAWWLGFFVFGWGYLYLTTSRWWRLPRGELPTMAMMEWIRSKWVAEAPIPNAHATNSIFFFGISHYIWTIVAAILGGVLARAFFAATVVRRGEAEPDARGAARHPARSWLGVAIIATAIAVLLVSIVAIGSMSDVRLRAGGMFLLSCGLFGTTAVGALFGRGWRREMAVGVALFGAGYLYLAMSTERPFYFEQPIPTLQPRVTDQFLDAVRSLLPPASRGIDPADARILKALEQPISMRSFDEAPLEDVLKYVAMATSAPDYPGIPIYVDPLGMQAAEKTTHSTVSIDLQGIPLKTTLGLCLKQLDLVYLVKDGCLQITSEDADFESDDHDPYRIVGHCWLALIAAGLGGVLAPLVAAASRDRPGRGAIEDAPTFGRSSEDQAGLSAGAR